jgi:hypothetical protein
VLFAEAVTGIIRSLQLSSVFEGHDMLLGAEIVNSDKPRVRRSCLHFMVRYLESQDVACMKGWVCSVGRV